MRDFFHGWRRKTGCITLVMALLFMGGWLRSQFVFDLFHVRMGAGNSLGLQSKRSTLCFDWGYADDDWDKDFPFWFTMDPSIRGTNLEDMSWNWQFCGLGYFSAFDDTIGGVYLIAPYWSTTIPLTLVSAYLILWKPRKKSSP